MARRSNAQRKAIRVSRRRGSNSAVVVDINAYNSFLETHPISVKSAPPLQAKTHSQSQYIAAIKAHKLTFSVGPAGTGKAIAQAQ